LIDKAVYDEFSYGGETKTEEEEWQI
jgi:hypothetical protein